MIPGFLTEELSSRPFRFPASLEQAYSGLIDELQREVAGFGRCTYCLEDTSRESVAWQFDRYLPAHYFKSYYSLLQMESDALQSQSDCHLLSWPSLTVIDVGCGSGAASLAALALLHRYQQYRIAHCAPIVPVNVLLIGVDPNPYMLELYSRMVESYSERLEHELVRVTYIPHQGRFPEDIRQVLRLYQPNNRHSVLVILSNVVRILEDLYSAGETSALEKVLRLLRGKKPASGIFGAAEGIAIESILEEWGVNCVSILGVATIGSGLKPHQWRDALHNLFSVLSLHTF